MSYSKTLVNIMLELQVCSEVASEIIFLVSKIVGFSVRIFFEIN